MVKLGSKDSCRNLLVTIEKCFKIHEERQILVRRRLPVGSHTNTSCPSNIAFIDKRCSSFRDICDICNFWRACDTASEKDGLLDTTLRPHAVMILSYITAVVTSPLHERLPRYPIFRDFSEIKRMRTTVCTRRSSSPLLQIGTPGYEANDLPVFIFFSGVSWYTLIVGGQ